jgi:hypothetical protein
MNVSTEEHNIFFGGDGLPHTYDKASNSMFPCKEIISSVQDITSMPFPGFSRMIRMFVGFKICGYISTQPQKFATHNLHFPKIDTDMLPSQSTCQGSRLDDCRFRILQSPRDLLSENKAISPLIPYPRPSKCSNYNLRRFFSSSVIGRALGTATQSQFPNE